MNEIEAWVTEQEKMVTQNNIGTELPFVHHQIAKFGEFKRELAAMEPLLGGVNERAGDIIEKGHSREVIINMPINIINI